MTTLFGTPFSLYLLLIKPMTHRHRFADSVPLSVDIIFHGARHPTVSWLTSFTKRLGYFSLGISCFVFSVFSGGYASWILFPFQIIFGEGKKSTNKTGRLLRPTSSHYLSKWRGGRSRGYMAARTCNKCIRNKFCDPLQQPTSKLCPPRIQRTTCYPRKISSLPNEAARPLPADPYMHRYHSYITEYHDTWFPIASGRPLGLLRRVRFPAARFN